LTVGNWVVLAQAEGAPAAVPEAVAPAEVHEEVGAEGEHAAEGEFPPFDPTFFASQLLWLAITFTALYLLMSRVVIPRIGGILEDRRDRIARDLEQAERLKQQSNDAIASYEKALSDARNRAFRIAGEARDAAKTEAASKQAATEATLDNRLAEAEKRIADIKAKALADVGAIASEAAEAVVERLLGKKPSAGEVGSAVATAQGGGAANV
jgi:F-type H+-transporting ATPase subunit b